MFKPGDIVYDNGRGYPNNVGEGQPGVILTAPEDPKEAYAYFDVWFPHTGGPTTWKGVWPYSVSELTYGRE